MPLSPISRRRLMASSAAAFAAAGAFSPLKAFAAAPSKAVALETMKKATTFMVEKAAYNGGYVWSYLPDFSRRWGEMEAFPTMIWVQPPGTAPWATCSWTPITPPATSIITRPPARPPRP
jgi:hypothetical protein